MHKEQDIIKDHNYMNLKLSNLKKRSMFAIFLIVFFIISLSSIPYCNANCTFYVVNNANMEVYAQAGFYKSNSKPVIFKINHASNNTVTIKSNDTCISTDEAGLGLAYINLINPKNNNTTGSWIYSPSSKMICAIGQSLNSKEGALGFSSDGTPLILLNNYKPDEKSFEVVIKQAARNISKPGSMN